MKLFFLLCIIPYALTSLYGGQGFPPPSKYCMGNINDSDECSSCYNWAASGNIVPRRLHNKGCENQVTNLIKDCKYYSGTTSTINTVGDCLVCHNKMWLNIKDNTDPKAIVVSCSDIPLDPAVCNKEVSNCFQSICYKSSVKGSRTKLLCGQCNRGFKGYGSRISSQSTRQGYYESCFNATIIHQDMPHHMYNTMAYSCESGYAVMNMGYWCESFTFDKNCRRLARGD